MSSKTKNKILAVMKSEESYSMSEIGYAVYGSHTANGKQKTPQGSALSVGQHVNQLCRDQKVVCFLESGDFRYRLPSDNTLFCKTIEQAVGS